MKRKGCAPTEVCAAEHSQRPLDTATSSTPDSYQASKADDSFSARARRTGRGSSALHESAGELSEQYATIGVLGRGSFSEINLLRHKGSGDYFALKTCNKLDSLSWAHLRAEATHMKKVSHPMLLTPLTVVDPPGRATNFSLLLPLCPGGDLLQLMRRQPTQRFSEEEARTYFSMVVLGLRALHEAGLAYRDLKPDNLLIRANGYLVLADFGFVSPVRKCSRTRIGTPQYQPPEMFLKQPHGAAADWWAAGVLLFELLSGSQPFIADDDEALAALITAHAGGLPVGASTEQVRALGSGADLIGALLQPLPSLRLGGGGGGGGGGVAEHAWLSTVEWEALRSMRTAAPHVPAPLDADADAVLLAMTRRCQSGFE